MRFLRTLATFCFFAAAAAPALAGPPLICHSIPVDSGHSLPWLATAGWNGTDPSYDLAHLQQDTLTLLTPSTPVEVREETLRRAVIYSARRSGLADALAVALMTRVLNAQAAGVANAPAWFDAGYFAETERQAAQVYPMLHGSEHDPIVRGSVLCECRCEGFFG